MAVELASREGETESFTAALNQGDQHDATPKSVSYSPVERFTGDEETVFDALAVVPGGVDDYGVENPKPRGHTPRRCSNRCFYLLNSVNYCSVIIILVAAMFALLGVVILLAVRLNGTHTGYPQESTINNNNNNIGDGGTSTNSSIVSNDMKDLPPAAPIGQPYPKATHMPFSSKHPVKDLHLQEYPHPKESAPPYNLFAEEHNAIPTNSWYQNFLLNIKSNQEPTKLHRAYTLPYLIDTVGAIPGIQVHTTVDILSSATTIQPQFVPIATMGAFPDASHQHSQDVASPSRQYTIQSMTELSITLGWDHLGMHAPLVRGMPFATMVYNKDVQAPNSLSTMLPTIAFGQSVIASKVDSNSEIELLCDSNEPNPILINHSVRLELPNESWVIYVSEPIEAQCFTMSANTMIQMVYKVNNDSKVPFVWRMAPFDDMLELYSKIYPGPNATISHKAISAAGSDDETELVFDWDAKDMSTGFPVTDASLLHIYALPHHQKLLDEDILETSRCVASLYGTSCLATGTSWNMLLPSLEINFYAKQPPSMMYIPRLKETLEQDLQEFKSIPMDFGDTYFSGKMLARLSRLLVIAEEVMVMSCGAQSCDSLYLYQQQALEKLKGVIEAWVSVDSMAVFVYDSAWGGMVGCGCGLEGDNRCTDSASLSCPALTDPGFNFGNGFYNDLHFHYGYFIYASAVIALLDPSWGRSHFEQVLLFVRSIANPSIEDTYFPLYRHKDWFAGHSVASGISAQFEKGPNQESSSEAIASYEAVALFGKAMKIAWDAVDNAQLSDVSQEIYHVGQILANTEIIAARTYYHVLDNKDPERIHPTSYQHNVVGIWWLMQAEYTTFFGNAPYYIYGIQLLPLTPIAEHRDVIQWSNVIYEPFAMACDVNCVNQGWYDLELAILSSVGYPELAVQLLDSIPDSAYFTPGGNGHSRSNSLWYIATRPLISNPEEISTGLSNKTIIPPEAIDCDQPKNCTNEVLNSIANGFSCGDRIRWLIDTQQYSQHDACFQVSSIEFPTECGPCKPKTMEDFDNSTGVEILENCYRPDTCSDSVLDRDAQGYSCRDRITWLINNMGQTQRQACTSVAVHEFPTICGPCAPAT